jgi:serine/threonine protein kinase/Tfp pilus assembly protein PilF
MYNFYNRKNEIKELLSSFDALVKEKHSECFIIQGKKDIGKTRLVQEFVAQIEKDIRILHRIPTFKGNKNVIEFSCQADTISPYYPFIGITKEIKNRAKLFDVGVKFFQIILAIFGINDALNALKDFAHTVSEPSDQNSEKTERRKIKIFNQYIRFISKKSSQSPLIIFIRNAQWIDIHSLKLLHALIAGNNNFWGMIILEYDDLEIKEDIIDELNKIHQLQNVNQLNLFSLDKTFPMKMLSGKFGEDFFNSEENDILFTISEGSPGKLIHFIENYCLDKLIFKENNKWVKKDEFLESIKPVHQKLLELIVSLYEDTELSEGELRLIRKMSNLWGIKDDLVSFTVSMVKDIMDEGFKIGQILGAGIFSKNSFLVYRENIKYIIEYAKIKNNLKERNLAKREIESTHLLEVKEIKISANGILLIWDYYDSKRTRDFLLKAFTKHLKDNLNKFIQLSEGLAELHKNDMVHGFIKPETIIETIDGKFKLASFDSRLIEYVAVENNNDNWETNLCQSPEQLSGEKISFPSDIYSLAILLYRSLTNKYPYHGKTTKELLDSIKNEELEQQGQFSPLFPTKIIALLRKATAFSPEKRYRNAEEFLKELKIIEKDTADTDFDLKASTKESTISPEKKTRLKKITNPILILIFILVLCGVVFLSWDKMKEVFVTHSVEVEDKITISVKSINRTEDVHKIIDPGSVEFLIQDDIQRSSNRIVLTEQQFKSMFPPTRDVKKVPKTEIIGTIINDEFNYELIVEIKNNETGKVKKEKILFSDPTELIKSEIKIIVNLVVDNPYTISSVTKDWDAFKSFIEGEKHWSILNKTQAKNYFEKSLNIDPEFILPKLRLAKIYHFEGNNKKALEQLSKVKEVIGKLSSADSIRTVALENTLLGNQREAINNYRALLGVMPAQKEPYFELAEAYFNIREVEQAMSHYNSALKIDNNFSLAINHYAYCFTHVGKHKEALELFRKYVSLDSSANSFDSYGDGWFAAGEYDSARIYKETGLKIDEKLDYLYNSLSYINTASGRIEEALTNIDDYLNLQSDPEMICNGLATKAFILYSAGEYNSALDTCLKAKSFFDSEDIVTRNHEMHWLLAKLYYKLGQVQNAEAEMRMMEQIIERYEVNANNYNEILKFYSDLKFTEYCQNQNINGINQIITLFDELIGKKIKDWSSPYDPAFFNTEFGITLLENQYNELATLRFQKALEYNPNYAVANYYLYHINMNQLDTVKAEEYKTVFFEILDSADVKFLNLYGIGNN